MIRHITQPKNTNRHLTMNDEGKCFAFPIHESTELFGLKRERNLILVMLILSAVYLRSSLPVGRQATQRLITGRFLAIPKSVAPAFLVHRVMCKKDTMNAHSACILADNATRFPLFLRH